MAKGRGSQPFIRALLVHPTMWLFLPYRAGIGEESFLIAGGATSPQGKFVQIESKCPFLLAATALRWAHGAGLWTA